MYRRMKKKGAVSLIERRGPLLASSHRVNNEEGC